MDILLGVIQFIKSLLQGIIQSKRRVKITCNYYSYIGPYNSTAISLKTGEVSHESGRKRSERVTIRVVCKGPRQVVIDKSGFQDGRRKKISPVHAYPYELPKTLTDGEFVEVDYSLGAIKQELAKQAKRGHLLKLTHAIVSDSEGKIHKTKIPEKLKLAIQN